jgi:hypothetical protein
MKLPPYVNRKHVARRTVVTAAIAAMGLYCVISCAAQTPTASEALTPSASGSSTSNAGVDGAAIQFVTRAQASMSPTATPKVTKSAKARHKTSAAAGTSPSPTTGSTTSGSPTGTYTSSSGSRSPYTWPFSWDSIWNIPIASTASYTAANIQSKGTSEAAAGADYDSTSPSFPVVTLGNALLANGSTGAVSVHGDPNMTAGGEWNTCSAFLSTDNTNVYQGQTTELSAGGNPYFGGTEAKGWAPVNIEGSGITGCHGGSGLSGLGGTLTLQDLDQSGPITHALKVALDGSVDYSQANGGFRWPAVNSDGGFNDSGSSNFYGGSNPNVVEGSLLALPPSISPSSFSNPTVRKIAQAMQDYGAYTVDTTATGGYENSILITNYNAAQTLVDDVCGSSCNANAFDSQLNTLLTELDVVTNNTPSTPGGGSIGASRCAPYAPMFDNGADAPPSVEVVGC